MQHSYGIQSLEHQPLGLQSFGHPVLEQSLLEQPSQATRGKAMSSFVIEGGYPLNGTVQPIGNKNAALPLLAACLLTDETLTLHNVPEIGDVHTMLAILAQLGVEIDHRGSTVILCARNVNSTDPNAQLFAQIRGSLTLMGPLLARHQHFSVRTAAGGDDQGNTHQVGRERRPWRIVNLGHCPNKIRRNA